MTHSLTGLQNAVGEIMATMYPIILRRAPAPAQPNQGSKVVLISWLLQRSGVAF